MKYRSVTNLLAGIFSKVDDSIQAKKDQDMVDAGYESIKLKIEPASKFAEKLHVLISALAYTYLLLGLPLWVLGMMAESDVLQYVAVLGPLFFLLLFLMVILISPFNRFSQAVGTGKMRNDLNVFLTAQGLKGEKGSLHIAIANIKDLTRVSETMVKVKIMDRPVYLLWQAFPVSFLLTFSKPVDAEIFVNWYQYQLKK